MNNILIEKILQKQNQDGSWGDPLRFYTDKYKGTTWNLIYLAELNADLKDERIQAACEFILNHSYDPKSGGFSVYYSEQLSGGMPSRVIPCLTGNMVYALIRLGYLNDPRVRKAIDWIVQYQRADDGEYVGTLPDKYKSHKACFGKHSCFMGVVKSLKALAEIPELKRSVEVNKKIQELSEFLLVHHIYKKSHDLSEISKPTWLKLRFPLMYQTDILEILDIFRRLNIKDERLNEAIEVVRLKEKDHTWMMESTYQGKLLVSPGPSGKPSIHLTKKAKEVLSFYSE